MFPLDFIKVIDYVKRYFLWIIALLITTKLAYKQLYPPPRITLHTLKQEYSNEEEWLTKKQLEILPNTNYRFKREYDTDTLLLLRHERYLFFSTKHQQDRFLLEIRGQDLLNATATFRILQANGSVIYTMTAPVLRAFCPTGLDEPSAKYEAASREIAHFFDDANLLTPALQDNERYDRTVHPRDSTVFTELFYHNDYNGFMYASFLNHDERIKIAYSRLLQRVVVYYRCCKTSAILN